MSRVRWMTGIALTLIACLFIAGVAFAQTATVTRSDGYRVTLTGPDTAVAGVSTGFTAKCGPVGYYDYACPYGSFRAYGGPINSLGEGFGTGASGFYVFRSAGFYYVRYRVGAGCIGSPRLACPIDVFLPISVTA